MSPANAETITAVASRVDQFPLCAAGMREGRLSVDQVGVIAGRAADGSDAHYAELAASVVCPFHHRLHHRGGIVITGPAEHLIVTDHAGGEPLEARSVARPPTTPPPAVKPCPGPTGERATWWWYQPYQPQPPPQTN